MKYVFLLFYSDIRAEKPLYVGYAVYGKGNHRDRIGFLESEDGGFHFH